MPIPTKVIDNSSLIKIKSHNNNEKVNVKKDSSSEVKADLKNNKSNTKAAVVDNSSEVETKHGCGTQAKVLELKINKETEERKEADVSLEQLIQQEIEQRASTDAYLQEQIDEIEVGGAKVDNTTILFNDNNEITLNSLLNANYYVVETLEERNSIPAALKKKGTIVKVDSTKIVYSWDGINWKKNPVNILSLGNGLKLSETGELSVDTTDEAIHLNQQPITSNGVYNILGDINDRLEDI